MGRDVVEELELPPHIRAGLANRSRVILMVADACPPLHIAQTPQLHRTVVYTRAGGSPRTVSEACPVSPAEVASASSHSAVAVKRLKVITRVP